MNLLCSWSVMQARRKFSQQLALLVHILSDWTGRRRTGWINPDLQGKNHLDVLIIRRRRRRIRSKDKTSFHYHDCKGHISSASGMRRAGWGSNYMHSFKGNWLGEEVWHSGFYHWVMWILLEEEEGFNCDIFWLQKGHGNKMLLKVLSPTEG